MINKIIILSFTFFIFSLYSSVPAANTDNSTVSAPVATLANVIVAPSFGIAPLDVSFDASEFLYHYGRKLSFSWDFNDGNKSYGAKTSHTFKSRGTYAVELTVTTPFGPQDAWVVIVVN